MNDQQIIATEGGDELAITAPPPTLPPPQYTNPENLPDLDGAKEGMSLAPTYREFNTPGETVRAVLCGFNTMNSKNKGASVPVAVFQNKEGVFVNAGANLVQQLTNVRPGTPVQIRYMGKEKTGSGFEVKVFDVRLLVNGASVPASVLGAAFADNGSKPTTAQIKANWLAFCKANNVTADTIQVALGTERVSEWLAADSARTLADAIGLVEQKLELY